MGFFAWLGRGPEKERAYARLKRLQEQYGAQGERVIKLSARTDIARKSGGSTARAFDYVESVFVTATQQYARIGEQLQSVEAGLARGQVGNMGAVEADLQQLGGKLDELAQRLSTWEAKWQEVPRRLEDSSRDVAALRQQLEDAAAIAGALLPPAGRFDGLQRYGEKAAQALADGNPIEADHLVDDLALALTKLSAEVGTYASGAAAITDVEQELTQLRTRATPELSAEATAASAAAESLIARLRPALCAGKLEQFQSDLLQVQKQLATLRSSGTSRE